MMRKGKAFFMVLSCISNACKLGNKKENVLIRDSIFYSFYVNSKLNFKFT